MKPRLLPNIFILFFSASPSFAQNYTFQDVVCAYQHGNYKQALVVGRVLATKNPCYPELYYYMANANARLGNIRDAIEEYSSCNKSTEDPVLKSYCQQALQPLIASTNVEGEPSTPQNCQNSRAFTQDRMDQVQKIRQSARNAIRAVPRYIDDNNGREPNPEYQSRVQGIRDQESTELHNVSISGSDNYMPEQLTNNCNSPDNLYPNSSLAGLQYMSSSPQSAAAMPQQPIPTSIYNRTTDIMRYSSAFDHSPLPPPPFPSSAKLGAEKDLHQKIN